MLNDAKVTSASSYIRRCRRVRNSQNIATISDFKVFFCVNATILVGSAMFSAKPDHACWITIIFGTSKNEGLKIHSLPSNNCFSYRNVLQNGVNTLSKMGLKELCFLCKSSHFLHFGPHELVQISPACSSNTYQ